LSLSIIIVNYRATDLILDALGSFLPFQVTEQPEIIIADNGNPSAEKERLQSAFPAVKIIDLGYNAGFARANNAGIRAASGDTILLLNPDILDPQHSIASGYHRFQQDSCIAAAVQLLNEDGSPQITGNYFVRGGLNLLLPLPVIGFLVKSLGQLVGAKKPNLPNSSTTVKVDWINGAFMMVRKELLAKTGLLDEEFFLYAEEIEWCARLRKAGDILLYGDLKLIHLQGESANKSFGSTGKGYYNLYDKKGLQLMVSNFLRIRKQFGAGWLMFHLFFYGLELPLLLLRVLIGLLPGMNAFPFQKWIGYCKNYFQLLKQIPAMLFRKPHFYKML